MLFLCVCVCAERQVRSIVGQIRPDRQSKHSSVSAALFACLLPCGLLIVVCARTSGCSCALSRALPFSSGTSGRFCSNLRPCSRSLLACAALLFSATMPSRIERLARDILRDPLRIAVGTVGGE